MSNELRLKYSHPYTLADLQEQDVNLISEEISRLQKSIALLQQTNETIRVSLNPNHVSASTSSSSSSSTTIQAIEDMASLSPEEIQEYLDVVSENEEIIEKQQERVMLCKFAMAKKMGFDPGNRHYDLDEDTTAIYERAPQGQAIRSLHGSDGQTNAETNAAVASARPPTTTSQDNSGGVYL